MMRLLMLSACSSSVSNHGLNENFHLNQCSNHTQKWPVGFSEGVARDFRQGKMNHGFFQAQSHLSPSHLLASQEKIERGKFGYLPILKKSQGFRPLLSCWWKKDNA